MAARRGGSKVPRTLDGAARMTPATSTIAERSSLLGTSALWRSLRPVTGEVSLCSLRVGGRPRQVGGGAGWVSHTGWGNQSRGEGACTPLKNTKVR